MVAAKNKQAEESRTSLTEHQSELAAFNEALELVGELGACPQVHYDSLEQALNHKNSLAVLEKDVETKQAETNPYLEQIEELKNTAVQEISWDHANDLVRVKEHQEFLYKLLTNKDSFVRKRIIDQNLAFLNQRLTYYLDKIGLPHIVEFQNDLTVIITQLGQDLDFDNLSRGERNRLILSMSWAFRDVWENLYHSINLLFIDELVDSGMDSSGVESSIAVLKRMTRERDKNVFLISHRDDLTSRVNHVLKVIKENGFTSYSNDIDIVE
jgi:DNA repair exonuclease SbcCD ATPase subunit